MDSQKSSVKTPRPTYSTSPIIQTIPDGFYASDSDSSDDGSRAPSIEVSSGSSGHPSPETRATRESIIEPTGDLSENFKANEFSLKQILVQLKTLNDNNLQPFINLIQQLNDLEQQEIINTDDIQKVIDALEKLNTANQDPLLTDLINNIKENFSTENEDQNATETKHTASKKTAWYDKTWVKNTFFIYALATAVLAYTSYSCNKTGAEELESSFESTYNIILAAFWASVIDVVGEIAGVGGVLCNATLNGKGTWDLMARINFLIDAFRQKSSYRPHYVFVGLAAIIATLAGSYQVAEAKLEGKELNSTLIAETVVAAAASFFAGLGQHVMFAVPGVQLYANSYIGDFSRSFWNFLSSTPGYAKNVMYSTYNYLKSYCVEPTTDEEELLTHDAHEQTTASKPFVSSSYLWMISRLILRAGQETTNKNFSVDERQQLIKNILTSLEQKEKFKSIIIDITAYNDKPMKYIEEVTTKFLKQDTFTGQDGNIISKTEWLQFLTCFGVEAANQQNIQLESTLKGVSLAALSGTTLVLAFITCTTNFNSIFTVVNDALSLLTAGTEYVCNLAFDNDLHSTLEIIQDIFYALLAPAGSLVKYLMYYISLDSVINMVLALPNTIRWLHHSTPAIKIGIPVITLFSLIFGELSGLCYGNASLEAFPELLNGNFAVFLEAISEEFRNNTQSVYVLVSILLGGGLVNTRAILMLLTNVYRTMIVQPMSKAQKATDALQDMLTAIAQKILQLVPDSEEAKDLRLLCKEIVHDLSQPSSSKSEEAEMEEGNPQDAAITQSRASARQSQSRFTFWSSNNSSSQQSINKEQKPKQSWSEWLGSFWSTPNIEATSHSDYDSQRSLPDLANNYGSFV